MPDTNGVVKVTLLGFGRQKSVSRFGRKADLLTIVDLRRLFDAERAINDLTGVRLHIEIVPEEVKEEE